MLFTFWGFVVLSTFHFIHNEHIIACLFVNILFLDLYLVCSPLIPELKEKDLMQEKNFEHIFKNDMGFYRVIYLDSVVKLDRYLNDSSLIH